MLQVVYDLHAEEIIGPICSVSSDQYNILQNLQ